MAISATERTSNVLEMVLAEVATLAASLPGTPAVYAAEVEVPAGDTHWIRVHVSEDDDWPDLGSHPLTGRAYSARALVLLDLFYQRTPDGADPRRIDKAAEELIYGLDNLSRDFSDYSVDHASPPTIAGARLEILQRPRSLSLPPENDLLRRQVRAVASWIVSSDN
jgi:hypothetical protein